MYLENSLFFQNLFETILFSPQQFFYLCINIFISKLQGKGGDGRERERRSFKIFYNVYENSND
jgi:hypothetical protein